MAKKDLINNEDFQLYQQDLHNMLVAKLQELDAIMAAIESAPERTADAMMQFNRATGQVRQLKAILAIPAGYLDPVAEADKKKKEEAKTRLSYLEILKGVLSGS